MLTPTDLEAAEAAWLEAGGVPPGRRQQGLGCVVAFLGMASLTLTPAIGNYVDIQPQSAYVILAVAVGLLFGGAALGLTGSRRARSAASEDIDVAVDRVVEAHAAGHPSLPVDVVHLIVLLRQAGPGVVGDVALKVGPARDYVQRVDTHFMSRPLGAPPS